MQLVLWRICGESRKRWNTTGSDTPGSTMEEWQDRTCKKGLEGKLLQEKTRRPEAQTWTDFEEDGDAVNQARAPKINDSGKSAYQRVFGKNPPQMEDAVLECGGTDRQQTRELAQERSMTVRRLALQASSALDHKRRWKRALHHAAIHYKGELHVGQPLWFWRRGANADKKPTNAFWHPGVVISNTLATVWIAYRGSVVKCAQSQVQPFHDDDEAAHEHVTEHMRDLGERLQHESDFSYEDITGQDEPPVDSPLAQGENTGTGPQDPTAKDRWMWTQKREGE